jgi:DNA-binding NtrC family response regulator
MDHHASLIRCQPAHVRVARDARDCVTMGAIYTGVAMAPEVPAQDVRVRILVVEDDAAARVGFQQLLASWGYVVEAAADGEDALQKVPDFRPDVVLTDLVMPRLDGLGLLRALQQEGEGVTTVILTAQGTVDTAVEALKQGAYDYLAKPVDFQRLRVLLDKIIERQATLREVKTLRRQLREHGSFGSMIGGSAPMREVYRLIEQAAPTSASVLITGDSGTGKELVAQTIHRLSPRASAPWVPLNCAAIPETLLESELFGHERGAFTGAIERQAGCFELAHRGTLFLDEIAEMTPSTQVKLLRVLQERSFRRLGGRVEQSVDIRVIAATNADPAAAVKKGTLREDLYYRLNVVGIHLPPLRERKDDLPLLIDSFLREFCEQNGKPVAGVAPAARRVLEEYAWPGNVRELRNVIERATIVAAERIIDLGDLPPLGRTLPAPAGGERLEPGMTVDDVERRLIMLTLEHTANNKTRAAELLGISLKTLHNKLNRFRLEEAGGGE